MDYEPSGYESENAAEAGHRETMDSMHKAGALDYQDRELRTSFVLFLCGSAFCLALCVFPTFRDWVFRGLLYLCYLVAGLVFFIGVAFAISWARDSVVRWVLLLLPLVGLTWAIWRYHDIERATQALAGISVQVDATGLKRDIGYILDKRETIQWRDGSKTIVWWVKVPSSDRVYSCEWELGYTGFSKNDGVVLFHVPTQNEDDAADFTGYIIGIHGGQKGKKAEVNALDQESLDDLAEPN